jgi:transposase
MREITTVGLDLAKEVVWAHGADALGQVVPHKMLRGDLVLALFGLVRSCAVALEACGDTRFWGREIGKPGQEVRLICPQKSGPP